MCYNTIKMTDYRNSCVYRFIYNDITYYVGSTVNYDKRYGEHKCACNNINGIPYNYPLYAFMRNNGGFEEFTMDIIQYYPDCESDLELRILEQHYYDIYNPSLNTIRPYLSKEELAEYQSKYQAKYRLTHSDYQSNYRTNNKAVITQKRSAIVNCPCGISHTRGSKWRHVRSNKHHKYLSLVPVL